MAYVTSLRFVYDLCSSPPPGGNPDVLASLLKSCNVFFLYVPVTAACQMFLSPFLVFPSSKPSIKATQLRIHQVQQPMHTTQHDETYTSRHKPATETLSVETGGGGGTDERETLTGWSRFIVHGRQDTYTHTWTDHTQRTQGIKHTCWRTLIYTVTHSHARAHTSKGWTGRDHCCPLLPPLDL